MMLEIGPRSQMKKELTNRNGHVIKLFKYDLLIFSLSEISDRFLVVYHRHRALWNGMLVNLFLVRNPFHHSDSVKTLDM